MEPNAVEVEGGSFHRQAVLTRLGTAGPEAEKDKRQNKGTSLLSYLPRVNHNCGKQRLPLLPHLLMYDRML